MAKSFRLAGSRKITGRRFTIWAPRGTLAMIWWRLESSAVGDVMCVKVGTFNLNNLFSRYNFRGELDALAHNDLSVNATITFDLTDPERFRIREFKGRLVTQKPAAERDIVAGRIAAMDVDVLAVQEVENIDTLNRFARDNLDGLYPYRALIEGNDPRLIDVGVLSKLPLGGVTSWRHAVHEETSNQTIFGRRSDASGCFECPPHQAAFHSFQQPSEEQLRALWAGCRGRCRTRQYAPPSPG